MASTLRVGSTGSEVKTLQTRLNSVLQPSPRLDVDGVFGPMTDQAVRRFQTQKHLMVDGIVGPQTWGALETAKATTPADPNAPTVATYTVRDLAREVAFWENGVRESPEGSNAGPKVDQYLASANLPSGLSWCMAFVYWCYRQASNELGIANPCLQTGLCQALYNWARQGDKLVTTPEDGDIFLVYSNGESRYCHTGIVVRAGEGGLTTVEGNTNTDGSSNGIGVFYRMRQRAGLKFVRLPDA